MLLGEAVEGLEFKFYNQLVRGCKNFYTVVDQSSNTKFTIIKDYDSIELLASKDLTIYPTSISVDKLCIGDKFSFRYSVNEVEVASIVEVIDKSIRGDIYFNHPATKALTLLSRYCTVNVPVDYRPDIPF